MKHCNKHSQDYDDRLRDCPICLGEELIKDPYWNTRIELLEPNAVVAIPLKVHGDEKPKPKRKWKRLDTPVSKEAIPTLFDTGNKPRFRREK